MIRRRPSDAELRSLLGEDHFGESRELTPADPVETTPMVVEIARIKPYDRNPRRERNPFYDEIRESIRTRGLQQPLVITRRPGEAQYMVCAGGNTRLAVLAELHAETGEERFARAHCLFQPWTVESDALAAHLVENDTRGALTFIDKAHAVREFHELLREERGERVGQDELVEALERCGYRLDRSLISRMDYAVDVLEPRIPEALRAGLGRPQVQRIRNLDRAAATLWRARELGDPESFAETFGALLARYDGADWRFDQLRRAVEQEVSQLAGVDLRCISMAMGALLAGREPAGVDGVEHRPPPRGERSKPKGRGERSGARAEGTPPGTPAGAPATSEDGVPPAGAPDPSPDTVTESTELAEVFEESGIDAATGDDPDPPAAGEPVPAEPAPAPPSQPSDIKSLRARAWVLASRIARRDHLGDIVAPLHGHGCGLLVDFVFSDPDDTPDTRLGRASLWWILATVSEQFYAPSERVARHLPAAWRDKPIARAIAASDPGSRTAALAEYAPLGVGPLIGPLVLAAVGDAAWADLLRLLDTYRRLRRAATERNIELWGPVA